MMVLTKLEISAVAVAAFVAAVVVMLKMVSVAVLVLFMPVTMASFPLVTYPCTTCVCGKDAVESLQL
eukprot:5047242-Ditylum_brightwellii.AAC.1